VGIRGPFGAGGCRIAGCALARSGGVDQCYLVSFFQPIDGCATLVLAENLHFPLVVAATLFHIDDALAVFEEERLARQIKYVYFVSTEKQDLGCNSGA
jgi:hypothetical protein